MKKQLLSILLFAFAIGICRGQSTYYVDFTNGNDAFSGTSLSAAWKTVDEVNSRSFNPGDKVLFKRGEVWVDSQLIIDDSGNSMNPITYGAYGIGPDPIISSVSRLSLSSGINWTWHADGIWKTTTPINNPGRLFYNYDASTSAIQEMLRAYDILNLGLDTKSGKDGSILAKDEFYWFNTVKPNYPVAKVLYVYTGNNNENPSEEDLIFKSTNTSNSPYCLIISREEYVIVENIEFHGGVRTMSITGTALEPSENIIIRDNNIGKYASRGIVLNYANSCEIYDNTFDSNYLIKFGLIVATADAMLAGDNPNVKGTDARGNGDAISINASSSFNKIHGNQFYNWSHAALEIVGASVTTGAIQGNKFYDNYITAPNLSYARTFSISGPLNSAFGNEFYNNFSEDLTIQSQIGGNNNSIHHNIFKNISQSDLRARGFANGIEVTANLDFFAAENNSIDNNLFIDLDDAGFTVNFWGSDGPADPNRRNVELNSFRNNILYNCGRQQNHIGIRIADDFHGSAPRLGGNTFQNNLIYNFDSTGAQVLQTIDYYSIDLTSTAYDYSTLEVTEGIFTVEEFNTLTLNVGDNASGNDAVDPQFINLAAGFHLAESSPVYNAGVSAVSSLYDFDFYGIDFPQDGTPDIGHQEIYQRTTKLTAEYCDENLLVEDEGIIACDPVPGADLYRFRFTDLSGTVQYVDSAEPEIDLFDAWWAQAKTTYNVTVRKVPDDTSDDYLFPHGDVCQIVTPHITRLKDAFCPVTLSGSGVLDAYPILNATQYTFRFKDSNGVYTYFTTTSPQMDLYARSWVQSSMTYDVQVKAVSPTSNPSGFSYGPVCQVTTPFFLPKSTSTDAKFEGYDATDVLIFPNPVESVLFIEANGEDNYEHFEIYDLSGKRIRDGNLRGTNSITLDHFASGAYIIKLYSQQKTVIKRLIKM